MKKILKLKKYPLKSNAYAVMLFIKQRGKFIKREYFYNKIYKESEKIYVYEFILNGKKYEMSLYYMDGNSFSFHFTIDGDFYTNGVSELKPEYNEILELAKHLKPQWIRVIKR